MNGTATGGGGFIPNEGDNEKRLNALNGAANALEEFYDSVVIVATARDKEGTIMHFARLGNSYAAIASAERWVEGQKCDWSDPD